MDHQAFRVQGLGRQRLLRAKVKLGIDVVFDQWNLVLCEQCNQRLLAVVGLSRAGFNSSIGPGAPKRGSSRTTTWGNCS